MLAEEPGLPINGAARYAIGMLVEEANSLGRLGAHEAGIAVTMVIAPGLDRVMVDRVPRSRGLGPRDRRRYGDRAGSRHSGSAVRGACDRQQNGMKLGLSICRTIVEAHGGRI